MSDVDVSDLGRLDVERYRRELAALPPMRPAQVAAATERIRAQFGQFQRLGVFGPARAVPLVVRLALLGVS